MTDHKQVHEGMAKAIYEASAQNFRPRLIKTGPDGTPAEMEWQEGDSKEIRLGKTIYDFFIDPARPPGNGFCKLIPRPMTDEFFSVLMAESLGRIATELQREREEMALIRYRLDALLEKTQAKKSFFETR